MTGLSDRNRSCLVEDTERALLASGHAVESAGAYIYAMILKRGADLGPLTTADPRLIYVGKADGRKRRDHLLYRSSSQSAPRRTLGALLKRDLGLTAFPRGRALTSRDFTHYNFGDGESRLTTWMKDHLVVVRAPVPSPARSIEKRLICRLQPSINLTDWQNPNIALIRKLKQICRDEAAARPIA